MNIKEANGLFFFYIVWAMSSSIITYLALGDSYTIGEGVPPRESFPYWIVTALRKYGQTIAAPEIVATTGWTTDELMSAVKKAQLLPAYDLVSLLIGVNNQYRGYSREEYSVQFEELLKKAIELAGKDPKRVFVPSIPDWSVSPFAATHLPDEKGRTSRAVAAEIDAFNETAFDICHQYDVTFIDITTFSRTDIGREKDMFAADGLHPSGFAYAHWAEALGTHVLKVLQGR